ncbi:MAG TPA: POTRA domain-containing protein, partial [Sphingomicrobium sp.]|nr:POTRA domain-containing protein [Sphingomicrobium sp.]
MRLAGAAGLGLALTAPVLAQPAQPSSAELDPSAPLDPMPDLGVEWPDLDARMGDDPQAQPQTETFSDSVDRRYSLEVRGIDEIGDRDALFDAFEAQSVLHAGRRTTANPAQIERRSRTDADLLAELLRSRGYFDAMVEPEVEAKADIVQIRLIAEPGAQYQFESVELPGLAAAGDEAAKLREVFAVKAGDPVIAEDVIAAGLALKVALGEEGYALAKVAEQQIDVNHETHLASLVLPVDPGLVATFGTMRVSG